MGVRRQAEQPARKLADHSFATSHATCEDNLRSTELIDSIYRKANR